MTRRLLVALIVGALVAASCGDDGGGGGDDELSMSQIQVLGSHNSYHLAPIPEALDVLESLSPDLAAESDYSHEPLLDQLDRYGIRQFEIDVYADPEGGRFADRQALPVIGLPAESGIAELDEPGFKVLHVQDYDFETTCLTLVDCLTILRDWSDDHRRHVPLMIMIEAKDDLVEEAAAEEGLDISGFGIDFTEPLAWTGELFASLEQEIETVFPRDRVITPDDLRGDHDTLREAVEEDGWPALEDARGKVVFALVDTGEDREQLRGEGENPNLLGGLLFTSADPGDPDAAFLRVDDPIEDADLIRELVEAGYLVRTRSDVPGEDAVTGSTERRDAAFASGAQYVSTDYYRPDTALSDFSVELPGGGPARCNPLNAPDSCTRDQLAER